MEAKVTRVNVRLSLAQAGFVVTAGAAGGMTPSEFVRELIEQARRQAARKERRAEKRQSEEQRTAAEAG